MTEIAMLPGDGTLRQVPGAGAEPGADEADDHEREADRTAAAPVHEPSEDPVESAHLMPARGRRVAAERRVSSKDRPATTGAQASTRSHVMHSKANSPTPHRILAAPTGGQAAEPSHQEQWHSFRAGIQASALFIDRHCPAYAVDYPVLSRFIMAHDPEYDPQEAELIENTRKYLETFEAQPHGAHAKSCALTSHMVGNTGALVTR